VKTASKSTNNVSLERTARYQTRSVTDKQKTYKHYNLFSHLYVLAPCSSGAASPHSSYATVSSYCEREVRQKKKSARE